MRPAWLKPRWLKDHKTRSVSEEFVVKETKKAAKKAGFEHRKIKYANHNGAPDDWFFGFDGRLIIIEFKAPGKAPEDHQWREIRKLRNRGFEVHVIDNADDGVALFAKECQW